MIPARTHSLQPGGRVVGAGEPWQRPAARLLPTPPCQFTVPAAVQEPSHLYSFCSPSALTAEVHSSRMA